MWHTSPIPQASVRSHARMLETLTLGVEMESLGALLAPHLLLSHPWHAHFVPACSGGRTARAEEELGALQAPSPPVSGMEAGWWQAASACAAVHAARPRLHRI